MKLTTQRTNKVAKLLWLISWLAILWGIFGLFTDNNWAAYYLAGGAIAWTASKLSAWYFNE